MNKKLFLAGVALLAAVGFTSCNSETPIDPSTPSGIAPAAVGHQVGVDYDWAVKANSVAQFEEYWAADKDAVQKLVKDKKVASICIIVDALTLDGKTIEIPQLWADANGKIVNVRIAGTFKNPDFLRAAWMEKGAAATKWPVKIKTDKVKGSEVNFTFDGGEFDFELETMYTRSTLNGPFTIGYFLAQAATGMSSVEIQSGNVVAIDIESTGDLKEKEDAFVTGVWTKGTKAVDVTAEKGIYVGENKYIRVENVFVEDDATINNLAYDKDPKKTYKLGTIQVVNPYKNVTVKFAKDKIYADAIAGVKADKNFVTVDDTKINLDYVGAIENITVKGATTLIQDVYTNVIFNDLVTFNTKEVDLFGDVIFNDLDIEINADDVTVMFDGCGFLKSVDLSSTLMYEFTEAWTETHTYQWIISDSHPQKGYYIECKNDLSDLKEYNKGKEIGTFAVKDVQYNATTQTFDGDKKADAKKYDVVVINTPHAAGKYPLTPNGTVVDLSSTCYFWNGSFSQNLDALNTIWGYKTFKDEGAWYTVKFADTEYIWRKLSGSYTYVLVKE
ncbi:MAG: hypothetical protein IKM77_01480 [Prevotella sp.]|nr:hypothetical protein [Prevotella sp.]